MMESTWDKVIKVLAAIAGAIVGALGGWDPLLAVLVGAMAADYVSGLVVAWMRKSPKTECGGLSSKVGARGLLKKGLMLLVVLIGTLLDRAIGVDGNMFRDAVCWFYVANEVISLMENMGIAGVKFPPKLMDVLGIHRKDKDNE